jgi:UDP-glucose 4-epimerase
MRFLVTGAAGFIGSHLCDALLSKGDSIVGLDDLSTGNKENLSSALKHENFKLVEGNILQKDLVSRLVEESDYVLHFAAAVGVQKILNDTLGSLRTNIEGSENVLLSATESGKPLILASTSEIYGKNSDALTEESDRILGSPLKVRWTYSEAKALEESVAKSLSVNNGLQVKIARLFNTVGPRQSAAYGMVIPRFFTAALRGESLTVHGDGDQQRIFCHVSDSVSAILGLIESYEGNGEAFNIGGFEEISISELAEKIVALTNSSSRIDYVPYEELEKSGFEDMPRRRPVTSKIQRATNWKPTKGIEYILKDYFSWLKNEF